MAKSAEKVNGSMLAVLEAIDEFWEKGQSTTPLHPYALITDSDEAIKDIVHAVVVKAQGK